MKIFLFTLLLFLCAPVWACENPTGPVEPGMEIICPEEEETPKELEEISLTLGLGLGDMMIIDEYVCKKIHLSHKEGLWCEYRIDHTNYNLYFIVYLNEEREDIREVWRFDSQSKDMAVIYAEEEIKP